MKRTHRINVSVYDKENNKVETLVKEGYFKSKSQVLESALILMLQLMEGEQQ